MKNIIVCIALFCITKVFPQKIDGICNITNNIGYPITNVSVEFYKKDTYIKKRYDKFSDVTNLSPEELLKSHISAQNNDWLSFNFGKTMNWENDKIKNLIDDNNYIELLFRLNFNVLNKEYSIIKLNAKSNASKNDFPITFLMQKNDNKWLFSDNTILQNLKLMMYLLSVEDIYSIFNNEKNSKNLQLNILINKIWLNNSFNFFAFINGFGEYLLRNNTKTDTALHLKENYLNDIKSEGIIPLLNQEFCYFFANENSDYNDKNLNSLMSIVENSKKENEVVIPNYYYKFNIEDSVNFIFSYNLENTETKTKEIKIIQISNNKIMNNSKLLDVFIQMKDKSNDYILKEKRNIVIK